GHDVTPNWPAFFDWVERYVKAPPLPAGEARPAARAATEIPTPRNDPNSAIAHSELVEKARKGGIDVYFEGDSIVRRWGASDPQYADLLANWNANFHGRNAGDFGWGADRIENILWRIQNGELDGVNPRVIVLLAGTNNIGPNPNDATGFDVTKGIEGLIRACKSKAPRATIILTAIFPRNDGMGAVPVIQRINARLVRLADGKSVRFLNVNDQLADREGRLFDGMMNAGDKLHPTIKGYQVWADGLKPLLTELLGPPAATDHAPPPTGDPSVRRSSPGA
ncbi:MAG TPA: GDSL-type esterase/lipase family protein, partial [Chthonomonadaceae bacterium]|nr:GDSL-type esterase/lipase family protein [Chthonomonadaceae bacterium]